MKPSPARRELHLRVPRIAPLALYNTIFNLALKVRTRERQEMLTFATRVGRTKRHLHSTVRKCSVRGVAASLQDDPSRCFSADTRTLM